jgi:hypothetical protein
MIERVERRRLARVALSGTPRVWTHDGLAARLLDLSLHGARLAHCGILRPGTRCFVHLPADLGSLRLPAEVLWCTILGAEMGLDGERYLQSHSGLWFSILTESQRTGLAGILRHASPADPALRDCWPQAGASARTYSPPSQGWAAARFPGKMGREASSSLAGLVGNRRGNPEA